MSFTDPNTDNSERASDYDVGYALLNFRWDQLLAWYGKAPQVVPELKGFIEHWKDFKKAWEDAGFAAPKWPDLVFYTLKPTEKIDEQRTNLNSAEWNAADHGYVVPHAIIDVNGAVKRADTGAPTGADSPGPKQHTHAMPATPAPAAPGVPTKTSIPMQIAQTTENVAKAVPGLGTFTDPRRMYPGGPIDPTKGDPKSLCDPCTKDYSTAWCKATNACPGTIGIGDIPLWVWALGATGVAAFTALAYTSFKAAPYVLSVIPQTAPVGAAWMQARAADAQQAESTRRAREAESVYRAQMSEVLPYYIDATGRRVDVHR